MIALLLGTCWRCEYQAKVGVGLDDNATVPTNWAPANCPACGLVSINIADESSDMEARCHECDAEVELYDRQGSEPVSRDRQKCPNCGEFALKFSPAES